MSDAFFEGSSLVLSVPCRHRLKATMSALPRHTEVIVDETTLIHIFRLRLWSEELHDAARHLFAAIEASRSDATQERLELLMFAVSHVAGVLTDVERELQACRDRGAILPF
jgi:hypothetical protein